MSFKKFLEKKKIPKVIDPGQGEAPVSVTSLPKKTQNSSSNVNQEVSLEIIVSDIITLAEEVKRTVNTAIDDIASSNDFPVFNEYHNVLKENFYDPEILLKDPTIRPIQVHDSIKIKSLEREVYRLAVDPRASFLQDLYNHKSMVGASQFLLKNYWEKIINTFSIEDPDPEYINLARFALGKEKQQLRLLQDSSERIKRNRASTLSYHFLKTLSSSVLLRVLNNNPNSRITELNRVTDLLKKIRLILYVTMIKSTEDWERFSTNLLDIYGNILQIIGSRAAKIASYPFVTGIETQILDFLESLEDFIPYDFNLQDIPEVREFTVQVEQVLGFFLSEVEEDLVARESIMIKSEENREILILNSRKKNKAQQFLTVIDEIIQFLESIKYSLNNLQIDFNLLNEQMILSLLNSLTESGKNKVVHSSVDIGKQSKVIIP